MAPTKSRAPGDLTRLHWHGSGDDPYGGLDRFDRVVDLLWRDYGSSTDAVRIKHGYDRAGNRLWRGRKGDITDYRLPGLPKSVMSPFLC